VDNISVSVATACWCVQWTICRPNSLWMQLTSLAISFCHISMTWWVMWQSC